MAVNFGRFAQQCRKPGPMLGAVDLGITDHGKCAGGEQAAQIAIALLADANELVLGPARVLLRHQPDPGEKFRPDRNAFGSATLATRAWRSAGPMPGMASSRLLVSLERCQARIRKRNTGCFHCPTPALEV